MEGGGGKGLFPVLQCCFCGEERLMETFEAGGGAMSSLSRFPLSPPLLPPPLCKCVCVQSVNCNNKFK